MAMKSGWEMKCFAVLTSILAVTGCGIGAQGGDQESDVDLQHQLSAQSEGDSAASPASESHETFTFSSSTILAVTMAPGGLFAPFPAGIPTFTEPAIADGFFLGIKLRDVDDNIVGFGTEQEVLNLAAARTATTYTLTLPGRGTLMLAQEEDLTVLLVEVNDMIANQQTVRSYDPPLVVLSTIAGTDRIIGGTGEFADAKKGSVHEYNILHKLDIATGVHDLEVMLDVTIKK